MSRLTARVDRFDDAADRVFDRLRGNPVADRVFYAASELGDWALLWHIVAATKAIDDTLGLPYLARVSATLGIESALVNGVIKSFFRRTRPVHDGDRPHRLRTPRTSSFPSGHASSAMTAAAVIGRGDRLRPAYYALGAVVAASRVHVRIHHASDVVGGLAVGVLLGAVANRVVDRIVLDPAA